MSIAQSNLSAAQFGYDFVVATTLESLNSTMFEFISSGDIPPVANYYWEDASNNTVAVDLTTLMNTAQSRSNPSGTAGINPASVANWDGTGTSPAGISQLGDSSFMGGFIAQVGIPPGFALPGTQNPNGLTVLPPIVSYDQTSASVTFNLYCSSFQVFQPNWQRGLTSYVNQSQSSGAAWYLQTTVPIKKILNNSGLPPTVQSQLTALNQNGEFFSVQQLFLDLDQPTKSTATSVNFGGIQPGSTLQTAIASVFAGDYCTALQSNGNPALGYAIAPNTPPIAASTLQMGAVEIEIVPYVTSSNDSSNDGLGTFNYLCSQTSALPAVNLLNWNWFDSQQVANQYSGVVAINRTALANYFAVQLAGIVAGNCWQPTVGVSASWPDVTYEFGSGNVNQPSPTIPVSGNTILSFNYSSTDASASGGSKPLLDYGSLDMSSSYSLNLSVNATAGGATSGARSGATITIVQQLTVYAKVCWEDTCESGNFVNKTITDTYAVSVDDNGSLIIGNPTSQTVDNSETPSANWLTQLFTQINDLSNWISQNVQFLKTDMTDVPLNTMQQFVFPGGQAFTYASVDFSENQDLVSYITYTNPA